MKKQFTIKKNSYQLAFFAAAAILLSFITNVQADVSRVSVVTVAQQGKPIAVYYKQGNSWVEIGLRADGGVIKYTETRRDEWSIYLDGGNKTLQLDLHTRTVNYQDNTGKSIPNLYQVMAFHN